MSGRHKHVGLAAPLAAAIEDSIRASIGRAFHIQSTRNISGGCIHRSYALEGGGERYFLKLNSFPHESNFAAEADGLAALKAAGVRAPQPIARGTGHDFAWLVLEYLDLRPGNEADYRELGRCLARMHARAHERYGWFRDNYIGATPQRNAPSRSWADFWTQERLAPQFALAASHGYRGAFQTLGEHVIAAVPKLLEGHAPQPSLLHGDLWSGNVGFLASGEPVIFDPAVYCGDAEADLAMTELFGGFPPSFHSGYREVLPAQAGYESRRTLYNLYHVLNHASLFGGGYVAQAQRMMESLLAHAR